MQLDHNGPEPTESTGDPNASDGENNSGTKRAGAVGFQPKSSRNYEVFVGGRWSRGKRFLFITGASVALWTTIILLWSRHF